MLCRCSRCVVEAWPRLGVYSEIYYYEYEGLLPPATAVATRPPANLNPTIRPYLPKGAEMLSAGESNSVADVVVSFRAAGLYDRAPSAIQLLEGYFNDTLGTPKAQSAFAARKLAIIRLDGDTYESTIQALDALYHHLSPGGPHSPPPPPSDLPATVATSSNPTWPIMPRRQRVTTATHHHTPPCTTTHTPAPTPAGFVVVDDYMDWEGEQGRGRALTRQPANLATYQPTISTLHQHSTNPPLQNPAALSPGRLPSGHNGL